MILAIHGKRQHPLQTPNFTLWRRPPSVDLFKIARIPGRYGQLKSLWMSISLPGSHTCNESSDYVFSL